MPIGLAILVAGIFTVRYKVGFALIPLGVLARVVFPIYAFSREASRVKLTRKIMGKIDKNTHWIVRMSEVFGIKKVKVKHIYIKIRSI